MKITQSRLKQIIREELEKSMNERSDSTFKLDPRIQKIFRLSRRVMDSDRVRSEVARSPAYQKGHHPGYSINNGNIVVVDAEGEIYYSPADANRADISALFDYLRKNNVPDRGYVVPTAIASMTP
tara:strand:+ start:85 stop:459 length:375 start_codon:yes stop_codon:yes gene_type:complete